MIFIYDCKRYNNFYFVKNVYSSLKRQTTLSVIENAAVLILIKLQQVTWNKIF